MLSSKDVKSSRVTGTRERMQESITIRKQKRLQKLKKRREARQSPTKSPQLPTAANQQNPGLPTPANVSNQAATAAEAPISLQYLDSYVAGVRNVHDRPLQLECTRKIRKLLSKEDHPPALEIISKGLVPILVEFLRCADTPKLQFEAAWALTNIASTEHTDYITVDELPLKRNAIPYLALLMKSRSADVREQSCWCLGNVAGDGYILRDIVLSTPYCLENLILNITNAHNQSMLKNATWALSNFCRGKPQPEIQVIQPALPILRTLIMHKDEEVLRDACWAFSYVSDGDDDRIQAVLNVNPTPRLVALLGHHKSSVVTPALRSLGNIISGNDEQTQHALNAGALKALIPLLDHDRVNIRKEACWTLSNIAAGTTAQARMLVNATNSVGVPVITRIIEMTNGGHYDVRKEAAWVIANICTGGDEQNIAQLVDSEPTSGLFVLCNLLAMEDPRMLLVGLEALESIFARGRPRPGQDRYDLLIQRCGGTVYLGQLCLHDDAEVFAKASHILRTYFDIEQDDAGGDDEDDDDDEQDGCRCRKRVGQDNPDIDAALVVNGERTAANAGMFFRRHLGKHLVEHAGQLRPVLADAHCVLPQIVACGCRNADVG